MPYFFNFINLIAISTMLLVYFFYNILNVKGRAKKRRPVYEEIAIYIYIAILASFINIMNSINLSDAVFWYGVSLSFGVKSSIFLVFVVGLLMLVSFYFTTYDNKDEKSDFDSIFKTIQESVTDIRIKQLEIDDIIKGFRKRFEDIATPEEVDAKIESMVEDKIDNVTSDVQHLSDKMAVIAEQLTKLKIGNNSDNLPSLRDEADDDMGKFKRRPKWLDEDDDNDE